MPNFLFSVWIISVLIFHYFLPSVSCMFSFLLVHLRCRHLQLWFSSEPYFHHIPQILECFVYIHLKVFLKLPLQFLLDPLFKEYIIQFPRIFLFSFSNSLLVLFCHGQKRFLVWFQFFKIYYDLCPDIWSILKNATRALEKNVYYDVVG